MMLTFHPHLFLRRAVPIKLQGWGRKKKEIGGKKKKTIKIPTKEKSFSSAASSTKASWNPGCGEMGWDDLQFYIILMQKKTFYYS